MEGGGARADGSEERRERVGRDAEEGAGEGEGLRGRDCEAWISKLRGSGDDGVCRASSKGWNQKHDLAALSCVGDVKGASGVRRGFVAELGLWRWLAEAGEEGGIAAEKRRFATE
eukprot:6203468-Pleurochrysis_carterae.AAC.1